MTLPNPYQSEIGSGVASLPSSRKRSAKLAYFSVLFAGLIAIGILFSQRNFVAMFIEFEIKLPLVTWIACWRGLPILILVIAILSFSFGTQPYFHSVANRISALSIGFTTIGILVYICGVFTPLMNLITGLSR